MYLIPALSRGAENIIDAGEGFDPDRILRFVANERVTVLPFLAPTMIVRLLEADPAIRVAGVARDRLRRRPDPSAASSRRAAAFRTRAYPALRSRQVADDHLGSAGLGARKRGRRGAAIRGLRPLGCGSPHPGRRRRHRSSWGGRRDRGAWRRRDAGLLAQRRRQRRVSPRWLAKDGRYRPLRCAGPSAHSRSPA